VRESAPVPAELERDPFRGRRAERDFRNLDAITVNESTDRIVPILDDQERGREQAETKKKQEQRNKETRGKGE